MKEGKSKAEISRLLDRDRLTITCEIKKETTAQVKTINGYQKSESIISEYIKYAPLVAYLL